MRFTIVLAIIVLWAGGSVANAQTGENFYQGKTVRLAIGSGSGGSIDIYARLMGRHLGKHIPGQPTIVPQNMPAGSGLALANFASEGAPRDGTWLGAVTQALPFDPLFSGGASNVRFDVLKWNWLASPVKFSAVAISWNASTPVRNAVDLLTHEMIVGSSGASASSTNDAHVLRNMLGFKYRVILGYPSGADIDLAMVRGETQGRANIAWQGLKSRNADWLTKKEVSILYQMGLEKDSDIPSDVPLILDFAKTDEDRQVLELKFASYALGYPVFAPESTPPERVRMLRSAFAKAFEDSALLSEAKSLRLDIVPVSGEAIQTILQKSYASSPNVRERLAQAGRPPGAVDQARARTINVSLDAVDSQGSHLVFRDRNALAKALIAGSTKLSISGNAAKPNMLKPGLTCEITYFGDGGQATSVICP